MKKIAIIGTHGVGKSFLCREIVKYLTDKKIKAEIVDEVVRNCPFPINDKGCGKTCEWIVHAQALAELDAEAKDPDYIICDRCVLDPIVYFRHTPEGKKKDRKEWMLEYYTLSQLKRYDAMYIVKPNQTRPIDGDGFRDTRKDFQLAIHKSFVKKIKVSPGVCIFDRFHNITQDDIYNKTKSVIEQILGVL